MPLVGVFLLMVAMATTVRAAAPLDTIIIDVGRDQQTRIAVVPFRLAPELEALGQMSDVSLLGEELTEKARSIKGPVRVFSYVHATIRTPRGDDHSSRHSLPPAPLTHTHTHTHTHARTLA